MRLYLGGKMSGLPKFGFDLFDEAAKDLRGRGYEIVSPAELDDPKVRDAAMASTDGKAKMPDGQTWGDFITRDLKIVIDEVDGVVLLPNWTQSKGARLETFTAWICGKPVYQYDPNYDQLMRLDSTLPKYLEEDALAFDVWFGTE